MMDLDRKVECVKIIYSKFIYLNIFIDITKIYII